VDVAVEAHGSGYSTLGPLSVSLHKTLEATGPLMHGCLILTAPDGDTLTAIYDGTAGPSNTNSFVFGTVTLTFTGGTGRFRDARGKREHDGVLQQLLSGQLICGRNSRSTSRGSILFS
jgi:hypothetical protein